MQICDKMLSRGDKVYFFCVFFFLQMPTRSKAIGMSRSKVQKKLFSNDTEQNINLFTFIFE